MTTFRVCCVVFLIMSNLVSAAQTSVNWDAPEARNPILPGYFADPSVVAHEGKFYLYATLDPWGGETLGCWESVDFANWTYRSLNWPTKAACTSATSKGAMVWAPSVVRGAGGRFYMYVSVGSEVWAGVADHPLGPWENPLGDRPLIPGNFRPGYHMIDAEAFVDDDGTAYLYWGSGWNWTNGRCFAVKLSEDMISFDGEPRDVTPPHYFEAPFMLKRGGRYFLMYSDGKTVEDTYEVRCAVGDSPLGPFTEVETSPLLTTEHARQVVSPGHHTMFLHEDRTYIVYHRHRIPYVKDTAYRQICMDELVFDETGMPQKVLPTHTGPTLLSAREDTRRSAIRVVRATASSEASGGLNTAAAVLNDNYATRWVPESDAQNVWLQLDLGEEQAVRCSEIRFEYAWKRYDFVVQLSPDGNSWRPAGETHATSEIVGSPCIVPHEGRARYVRIQFSDATPASDIGIFSWRIY